MSVNSSVLPDWFIQDRNEKYLSLLKEYDPKKVGNLGWKFLNSEASTHQQKAYSWAATFIAMMAGGYAGMKTGDKVGESFESLSGYGTLIRCVSSFMGGISGAYVGYKVANYTTEQTNSFQKWKGMSVKEGINTIFDIKFKEYFIKNQILDKKYSSSLTSDFLTNPITLDGTKTYNKEEIKKLTKNENGEIINKLEKRTCKISGYRPAYQTIINMSAVKIYALSKEIEIEKINHVVLWLLTEYIAKESASLKLLVQDLSNQVETSSEKLKATYKEKLKEIDTQFTLAVDSLQSTMPKNKWEKLTKKINLLNEKRKNIEKKKKAIENTRKAFIKNKNIIKKNCDAIADEIGKMRSYVDKENITETHVNLTAKEITSIHIKIQKLAKSTVKITYENNSDWIPKSIYK